MKKGKLSCICAITASAVLLSGCIDNMPDMTQEQTDLVAEYAAGLMLKYSKNYDYKIADNVEYTPEIVEEPTTEAATEEPTTETVEVEKQTEENTDFEEENETESAEEFPNSTKLSIEDIDFSELLGQDEIEIVYEDYEVLDSYPKEGKGFVVSASGTNRLLVLHFDLKNRTDNAKECNTFDINVKAKVVINGSDRIDAMSTLLVNDLLSYCENVDANSEDNLVLLFAIDSELAEEIDTMDLLLETDEEKFTIEIQ